MLAFFRRLFGMRPHPTGKRSSADFPLIITTDGIKIGLRVVFDSNGEAQIEDHRCAIVANGQVLTLRSSEDTRSFCPAVERYLMQNLTHPAQKSRNLTDRDIYRSLLAEDGVWGLPLKRVNGTREQPFTWAFVRRGPTNVSYHCQIDIMKRVLTFKLG